MQRALSLPKALGAAAILGLGASVALAPVLGAAEAAPCAHGPAWLEGPAARLRLEAPSHVPRIRVTTYNIHSGLGLSPVPFGARAAVERRLRAIASELSRDGVPDVVVLNEVDFAARRSGGFDEAAFLAGELERLSGERYAVARQETWRRTLPGVEVSFGNAVLSRHRIVAEEACLLDGSGPCRPARGEPALRATSFWARRLSEPRGVLKVTLQVGGQLFDVIATHLEAFVAEERQAQAMYIVRHLVDPARPTVLAGDLNAVPRPLAARRPFFGGDVTHDVVTSGRLVDARLLWAGARGLAGLDAWATYPADAPAWPLDAILGTPELVPEAVTVVGGRESDHRGLSVRYALGSAPDAGIVAAQRAIRAATLEHNLQCLRRRGRAEVAACRGSSCSSASPWRSPSS